MKAKCSRGHPNTFINMSDYYFGKDRKRAIEYLKRIGEYYYGS